MSALKILAPLKDNYAIDTTAVVRRNFFFKYFSVVIGGCLIIVRLIFHAAAAARGITLLSIVLARLSGIFLPDDPGEVIDFINH